MKLIRTGFGRVDTNKQGDRQGDCDRETVRFSFFVWILKITVPRSTPKYIFLGHTHLFLGPNVSEIFTFSHFSVRQSASQVVSQSANQSVS